jgi:signal peptidase I
MRSRLSEQVIPPGVAKGFLRDNLEVVCFAILMIMFFKTFVGQQFTIPSASMRNTLMIGDHLLVNKFIFAVPQWSWEKRLFPMHEPKRGDIIVFRYPLDRNTDYVKRCVALPGDTVAVRDKRLYVNGKLTSDVSECHILDQSNEPVSGPWPIGRYAGPLESAVQQNLMPIWPFADPDVLAMNMQSHQMLDGGFRDNLPLFTVPFGRIFVMGDNRDNSADSRYWGLLPIDHLRGRPFLVWWSYREGGDDGTNANIPEGPLDVIINFMDGARYFFTRTRWERTGYIPR